MRVIYKLTNTENGKSYIGQTKDFAHRMRGHRSTSYNPASSEYDLPIHHAIRKYGWDKFQAKILEELPDDQDFVDERERFFIQHFQTLVSQKGYNVSQGGQGFSREPLTYEEKISKSTLFTAEEIRDIQQMLIDNYPFSEIIAKYSPLLKESFLSNINTGLAFSNPDWNYPLKKDHWRSRYSPKEIDEIKTLIRESNLSLKEIGQRYGCGHPFVSMINTGKYFYDASEAYPLRMSKHGRKMAQEAFKHLILTDFAPGSKEEIYREVASKCGYNQTGSVKKIDLGLTHRQENFQYPLLNHQKENRLLLR